MWLRMNNSEFSNAVAREWDILGFVFQLDSDESDIKRWLATIYTYNFQRSYKPQQWSAVSRWTYCGKK